MIEPTESESLAEIDLFIAAMIAIRKEIDDVQQGRVDAEDNPLKQAPHTAAAISGTGSAVTQKAGGLSKRRHRPS